MLTEQEMEQAIRWSKDSDELYNTVANEEGSVYREMSENVLRVIQNFESHAILFPTGKNFFGIEDLYTAIQLQFEGGEDLMSD